VDAIDWISTLRAKRLPQLACGANPANFRMPAFSRFFGLGPLSRPFGIGLYFLVVATTGVIQNCATTPGEEIGWRGFLVPELAKRFSFTDGHLVAWVHELRFAIWKMMLPAPHGTTSLP
jgi:hypothetical protein